MGKWKVVRLGIKPETTIDIPCDVCGWDSTVPCRKPSSPVIAAVGTMLIYDNAWADMGRQNLPTEIQCPHCKTKFEYSEGADFRQGVDIMSRAGRIIHKGGTTFQVVGHRHYEVAS